jgi:hypothetical protein
MAMFIAVDRMVNLLGKYMSFAAVESVGQRPHCGHS